MPIRVEAIYEDGMLRPLTPLELREHQRVELLVRDAEPDLMTADEAFPILSGVKVPTHEEVRRALSSIPTPLSDAVDQSREERFS